MAIFANNLVICAEEIRATLYFCSSSMSLLNTSFSKRKIYIVEDQTLESAFDQLDVVVLLQSLDQRGTDIHGHGSEDTLG